MTDHVQRTRETYDRIAGSFLANTRDRSRGAVFLDRFARHVSPGGRVLDLGAGPGCDSALLRERGFEVLGVDLSIGMLRAGLEEFPGPRVQADFRAIPVRDGCIDGVWANASLLHASAGDLALALAEIARVCTDDAAVHLSMKRGEGEEWERERYELPRWYRYWSAAALDEFLAGQGFRPIGAWEKSSWRDDWLFRLLMPPGS